MKLQRLRAFNETGLRMLREGADFPLAVASFAETDTATELPLEWRSQLKIARKLGEGSFGKVYKCKVLRHSEVHRRKVLHGKKGDQAPQRDERSFGFLHFSDCFAFLDFETATPATGSCYA